MLLYHKRIVIGVFQEKPGFFFCLEDRALLCRDCDVSIHSANKLSSNHQRFLLTGTRVGLDSISGQEGAEVVLEESPRVPTPSTATSTLPSISKSTLSSGSKLKDNSQPVPANATPTPNPSWLTNGGRNSERAKIKSKPVGTTSANVSDPHGSSFGKRNSIPADFLSDAVPVWGVDELLNLPELAEGYHIGDIGSSKADMNNLGDYDWMADLSMFEEQMYAAGSFHEVPQLSAPAPTVGLTRGGRATALSKGKGKQDAAIVPQFDDAFVVPDLGLSVSPSSPAPVTKRRRT